MDWKELLKPYKQFLIIYILLILPGLIYFTTQDHSSPILMIISSTLGLCFIFMVFPSYIADVYLGSIIKPYSDVLGTPFFFVFVAINIFVYALIINSLIKG
jgi:hypothetical protein